MRASTLRPNVLVACGLLTGALVTSVGWVPAGQPEVKAPAAGLKYVPADAAIFAHVEVARLWGSPIGKSLRAADPKIIEEIATGLKGELGITPDAVRRVTVFIPRIKGPTDLQKLGVIVEFDKPFDAAKLKAGADKLLMPDKGTVAVHSPSDTLAVVLVNLDEAYAKPQPADKTGPLTAVLKQAASGTPVLAAGATLANMPDEIRGDDIPEAFKAFRALANAESITGTVELGTDITAEVRVKTATPGQAVEAEKAMGLLRTLVEEGLDFELKRMDAKDPTFKDILAIGRAVEAASKGAKFTTEGTEARVAVKLPADLPFAGAFVNGVAKTREAAANAQSANNLKQIALAMHNYESTYESFPPAALCDKTGKPLLSWRVLILPYIEEDPLYKQFKLDEPWDSDHNKKLLDKMPRVYALPNKYKPGDTTTHYRVFVGNGAGFDYVRAHKITQITDGTSNTIMCVTAAEAVPWTKPDELAFDPEKDAGRLLGGVVNGLAQAAFFDGSVRTFRKIPAKATINALITRAGGEVIGDIDK